MFRIIESFRSYAAKHRFSKAGHCVVDTFQVILHLQSISNLCFAKLTFVGTLDSQRGDKCCGTSGADGF